MQKIMFNDLFGLTKAVLDGTKTMTRRAVGNHMTNDDIAAYLKGYKDVVYNLAPYKIGEVVAVAQSYEDLGYSPTTIQRGRCVRKSIHGDNPGWTDDMIGQIGDWYIDQLAGWNNKMFVPAAMCQHQIRITDIKVERLQDISDEDCMKEGIYVSDTFTKYGIHNGYSPQCANDPKEKKWWFNSPREAFATLIDKVSGKGTWESNPWVFAYEFELVK